MNENYIAPITIIAVLIVFCTMITILTIEGMQTDKVTDCMRYSYLNKNGNTVEYCKEIFN